MISSRLLGLIVKTVARIPGVLVFAVIIKSILAGVLFFA